MPRCLQYNYDTDGTPNDGIWFEVFERVSTPVENCGDNNLSEEVVLSAREYHELTALAGQLTDVDQAVAAIDPVEVSAVFGTCFALIFFAGYLGYQIRVGKNIVKSI